MLKALKDHWKESIAATGIILLPYISNLPAHLSDETTFSFPDHETLHPTTAPENTQRSINTLWTPHAYLQAIDCAKESFEIQDTNNEYIKYSKYDISTLEEKMEENSADFSVFINNNGHAIIIFKAMDAKGFEDTPVTLQDSYRDIMHQDSQLPIVDLLIDMLKKDENVKTIETIGFAQGSQKVYHLAEKENILGTIISDTGTNYTSPHLTDYVIALEVPGDIHSFISTGEHKPANKIHLGEELNWSFKNYTTPLQTSWIEQIHSLAMQYSESEPPEGYEDKGIKILNPDEVCNNPTMEHNE